MTAIPPGEPAQSLNDRFPSISASMARLSRKNSDTAPDQTAAGFLVAVEPLIRDAHARLGEGVDALAQPGVKLPFDPDTVQAVMAANLPARLLTLLTRTMVLELHVSRMQGNLQGDDPQARFQSFVQRLRRRDVALALLREYPVLARQIIRCLDQWVAVSLEFLRHLCDDHEAIRARFGPEGDLGVLDELNAAGDRHRGGRSVQIARFSSGVQVVYKPKSLAVDVHFQGLLTWLNERGSHPPFRTLSILDRGDHGWVEFVAAQGCRSAAEVERFYVRQGGYLAILHGLAATDFHFENLIAAGEHPVLLDLEALFHPDSVRADGGLAEQVAAGAIDESVLRVGLLPQRIWANPAAEGIDLSGLGAQAGQMTPYPVPQWEGAGTDDMHLARRPIVMPTGQNRPTLNGAPVDLLDYADAIVAGFASVYRLLLAQHQPLLAEAGPLARFGGDEVRVVLRPTRTYGLLLYESTHPDVLRDGPERERLFDRLWAGVGHNLHLARVIGAERADLDQGDIPYFRARPHSRDLWSSTGERLSGFFGESGQELARRRLRQFDESDLERQCWFIRASLSTLAPETQAGRVTRRTPALEAPVPSRADLLGAACAVGDRLEALALRGEDDATWIGLSQSGSERWSLAPLGLDLYNGVPGVMLFLAYLGAITRRPRYSDLAQAALTGLQRQMAQGRDHLASLGGFDGWGGIIYTLTHLGVLWDRLDLLAEAEGLVDLLPARIESDIMLDVIGGAAGCIGSLLGLHRWVPSQRVWEAAVRCGDHLLARAQPMAQGLAWMPPFAVRGPLTGFAHGAAGIAWALLGLSALTGAARFRKAALATMDYERSLFVSETGNWPDLRLLPGTEEQEHRQQWEGMVAWCHGAPGIGLARLRCLPHLDDAAIRAEIDVALQTTLRRGFGDNHSLCHGDLGNLELMLQASRCLDDPCWSSQADRLAGEVLQRIDEHGWLCSNPLAVESPGLMTGLAGIGYELLRLAEPDRVPSVLALEPPRGAGDGSPVCLS